MGMRTVTTPQSFTRRSTRIEAMRLDSDSAMYDAQDWLQDHGVSSRLGLNFLWIHSTRNGMAARIGQWLTYDPASRQFAVYNHDHFVQDHPEAQENQ